MAQLCLGKLSRPPITFSTEAMRYHTLG